MGTGSKSNAMRWGAPGAQEPRKTNDRIAARLLNARALPRNQADGTATAR
jgi:hypothetical protein